MMCLRILRTSLTILQLLELKQEDGAPFRLASTSIFSNDPQMAREKVAILTLSGHDLTLVKTATVL